MAKHTVYRDKRGRFISPKRFFIVRSGVAKKRYKSYSRQVVVFPDRPKKHAPLIDTKFPFKKGKKHILKRVVKQRINIKLKKLHPFLTEWEDDKLILLTHYSIVGRYVKYDIEKYYKKARVLYTEGPLYEKQQRQLRGIIYNARVKAYQDILGISRKEAQAVYRIVTDPDHPQYLDVKEKIYGLGKKK